MDQAERRALANYGRAVGDLFNTWRIASRTFSQAIDDEADDTALQQHLDQLGAIVQQADALAAPEPAAPLKRVFVAMLRSELGYHQSVFDDADDAVMGQYAADFQEEGTMFLTEFDRLVRITGESLQRPQRDG